MAVTVQINNHKNYHGHSLHPVPPLIFDCLESALLLDPDEFWVGKQV